MKIDHLIEQLEDARAFLGFDADIFVGLPNGMFIGHFEVVSDKNLTNNAGEEGIAIIQTYIAKGSSK